MRRDHRPYALKRADLGFQRFYVRRFLRPQLDDLGDGWTIIKPWYVEVFGPGISVGRFVTVVAAPDRRVRLAVWPPLSAGTGSIRIGDYCLISPGVRMGAAVSIRIGDNVMIGSGAYITDADWHGIHDRVTPDPGEPVEIGENAWIGDSAIVCKGVTVGVNSIIGAGAVVTRDIPENAVAAGNPARVVRRLDPTAPMRKRCHWYHEGGDLFARLDRLDREKLRGNTLFSWLRHLIAPEKGA